MKRKILEQKTFKVAGTFESMYAAHAWVKQKGYSEGSTCYPLPTAVMKGNYYDYGLPHKMKNFTKQQKQLVHGIIDGDFRDGPLTVTLYGLSADAAELKPINQQV